MPIQILPAAKTFGGEFAKQFGAGAGKGFSEEIASTQQRKKMDFENEKLGIPQGTYDPDLRKAYMVEMLKSRGKEQLFEKKQGFLGELFGGKQPQRRPIEEQLGTEKEKLSLAEIPQNLDVSQIPDEAIAQATAVDPQLGSALQRMKDVSLREKREKQKTERKEFESERAYQTGYSKEVEKEADTLRGSIPRLEMALDFARDAIETGNVSYFSPDKLADITGIDLFRTAKGAQLITAGKENLLGNMSRASARAQNLWFEQRLNSMFAKIGQSPEANLTTQEMIEGEVALNKSYLSELDRLAEEDEKEHGFVKKDVKKRALASMKPKEKEILARTSYRMKEIEENEKGLSGLKKMVGKNVTKGTPLTLAMAKLYKEKFGENALQVAKKNGYSIPTLEEFKIYQQKPREFREELAP